VRRVRNNGLSEGAHAIADGFDAGHRSTAAGESTDEKPKAEGGGRLRELRRGIDRLALAATHDGFEHPHDHHAPERRDKEIRRKREGPTRFPGPAQVHERHDGQNRQAECDRVRLQRVGHRDERSDAGGDRHGDIQNVIETEGRCREQAGKGAQVLAGHCV